MMLVSSRILNPCLIPLHDNHAQNQVLISLIFLHLPTVRERERERQKTPPNLERKAFISMEKTIIHWMTWVEEMFGDRFLEKEN